MSCPFSEVPLTDTMSSINDCEHIAKMNMTAPQTLFDLGRRPTTRAVADRVRASGVAGLPGAVRRGDNTRYQEVVCRTALNKVAGMPFGWALNPYRGCTHGCHFCFARRYQTQLELGPGDDFSSLVLVKVNFPDVLAAELARPTWRAASVALGTATDPYQPIEGRARITRRSLEVLCGRPTPIELITRGPLVVRDADVLAELATKTSVTVTFSIPTVDEDAWQRLEPGTAHPLQRLRAVNTLARAGIDTGVIMAPIVPGLSSHPSKLERTVRAIADHGAGFVGAMLLHLEGGTRQHFLDFLSREYPHLVERYGRLYAGKYASAAYGRQFRAVMGTLKTRYGVTARTPLATPQLADVSTRPSSQTRFRF